MGFVGRALCDRQPAEQVFLAVRGDGLAWGDLAVLYESAEFLVDFLSVAMSWCRSFAFRGGGEPQNPNGRFGASLPPLVHLAPDYFSVAKWANLRTTNWD